MDIYLRANLICCLLSKLLKHVMVASGLLTNRPWYRRYGLIVEKLFNVSANRMCRIRIGLFWVKLSLSKRGKRQNLSCVACEQAVRGGKRKESLQLRLWNLNICIEKVDAKCWLAEMALVMTLLPLPRVFQCFALVSASRWLAEIWQLSRRGATGELEVEFKFQRRSCKLSFLFPFRRQSAPESLLASYFLCKEVFFAWE